MDKITQKTLWTILTLTLTFLETFYGELYNVFDKTSSCHTFMRLRWLWLIFRLHWHPKDETEFCILRLNVIQFIHIYCFFSVVSVTCYSGVGGGINGEGRGNFHNLRVTNFVSDVWIWSLFIVILITFSLYSKTYMVQGTPWTKLKIYLCSFFLPLSVNTCICPIWISQFWHRVIAIFNYLFFLEKKSTFGDKHRWMKLKFETWHYKFCNRSWANPELILSIIIFSVSVCENVLITHEHRSETLPV